MLLPINRGVPQWRVTEQRHATQTERLSQPGHNLREDKQTQSGRLTASLALGGVVRLSRLSARCLFHDATASCVTTHHSGDLHYALLNLVQTEASRFWSKQMKSEPFAEYILDFFIVFLHRLFILFVLILFFFVFLPTQWRSGRCCRLTAKKVVGLILGSRCVELSL